MALEDQEKMRLKQDLEVAMPKRQTSTPNGIYVECVEVQPESLKEVLTHIIEAL